MGEPWTGAPAWRVVDDAEAALGEPLAHLLLDAPEETLRRTREAQLAVFLHSLMAWEAAKDELDPERVVAFAGHSLGQVTALVASGALSLEDGVRLVARRANETQVAADRRPGRMAALMGAGVETAEAACEAAPDGAWVANDNAPGQVVLGGTPEGVEAASQRAGDLGVRRVVALNVGGAFHTPLMAGAAAALRPVLDATPFRTPAAPVVSNVDARPHVDPADWPRQLADHLVNRVRWRECVLTLSQLGAHSLVEVGPGTVLGGLARRTVPGITIRNVATPGDLSNVAAPDDVTSLRTPMEVC
jgi:[acyl-carrier-protein] S-malonyltransferase